jgi:hypothetical protein
MLERSLLALHATAPALRLGADHLIGDDDRVVAVVRTQGGDEAAAFGLTLVDHRWWSSIDVFRVVDGRVAERTVSAGKPTLLEPLVRAPVTLSTPARLTVTALQITVAPGGRHHRATPTDGLRVLVAETGELNVTVTMDDRLAPAPGSLSTPLQAGGHLILDGGAGFIADNIGREPAVFLSVLASMASDSRAAASPFAEGVGPGTLTGSQSPAAQAGPTELIVGRAMLPSGSRLAWTGPAGPILLSVAQGTLELWADKTAFVWFQRLSSGSMSRQLFVTLSTGDGGLLAAGTEAEIRNTGETALEVFFVARS